MMHETNEAVYKRLSAHDLEFVGNVQAMVARGMTTAQVAEQMLYDFGGGTVVDEAVAVALVIREGAQR